MILALAEVSFLLAFVAGVYVSIGLGAALIALGLLGVIACEWHSARQPRS